MTGTQAVLFVTSPQSLGAVVTASKQLGYNQTFGSSFVAPSQLKAYGSALNGLVVDSYLPAIRERRRGTPGSTSSNPRWPRPPPPVSPTHRVSTMLT